MYVSSRRAYLPGFRDTTTKTHGFVNGRKKSKHTWTDLYLDHDILSRSRSRSINSITIYCRSISRSRSTADPDIVSRSTADPVIPRIYVCRYDVRVQQHGVPPRLGDTKKNTWKKVSKHR